MADFVFNWIIFRMRRILSPQVLKIAGDHTVLALDY